MHASAATRTYPSSRIKVQPVYQTMEYVPQIDAPALYPVQTFVPIELGSVSADAVEPINAP